MFNKLLQILFLSVFLCIHLANGQAKDTEIQPYITEIQAFEKADKQHSPPKNAILFTGSSSIRLWADLSERFSDKKVINRGFGGSGLTNLDYYADRIIFPYKPKQVIIYSGENDIAAGKSAEEVFINFKKIAEKIKKRLPSTRIAYISMKPSPSRVDKIEEVKKANALIQSYLVTTKTGDYINIFDPMLDSNQQPRPEFFVADQLHMNKQGYDIWTEVIKPYLK